MAFFALPLKDYMKNLKHFALACLCYFTIIMLMECFNLMNDKPFIYADIEFFSISLVIMIQGALGIYHAIMMFHVHDEYFDLKEID